jgi:NADH:ubiquinone oxidoreductase subunit 6 (subunit J)
MHTIATALINWNAIWRIILTALVGGTGVVIVFGLALLGISRAKTATRPATRYFLYTVSGLCALLVLAVATVGVYTMTRKTSPAKPDTKASAATLAPPSATQPPPVRAT